jgi:hypothetical protein
MMGGVMRMALAPALVLVVLAAAGCGSSVRANYVKQNEKLFRSLPTFPGAVRATKTSAPYSTEEEGPIRGYTTTFRLRLPENASSEEVAAFYARRLQPSWRLVERLSGPVLNLRRGSAAVSINLEGAQGHELEITLDYDRDDKFRS